MTEQELIEQLSDKEHDSWARWMAYLFSKCWQDGNGCMVIPEDLVDRWQRQVDTPYSQLSEQEKQSDRNEVTYILPIIKEYAHKEKTMQKDLEGLVWEALGESSMCWSERPRGEFDQVRVKRVGEELIAAIDASLRKRDELPRNSVPSLPWGEPHDG